MLVTMNKENIFNKNFQKMYLLQIYSKFFEHFSKNLPEFILEFLQFYSIR